MINETFKVDSPTTMTTPASYVTALVGLLTAVDWEKAIYIVLAIATFAVNWYYQHKRLKISEANKREHDATQSSDKEH